MLTAGPKARWRARLHARSLPADDGMPPPGKPAIPSIEGHIDMEVPAPAPIVLAVPQETVATPVAAATGTTEPLGDSPRARIDRLIEDVFTKTGRRISRVDISWAVGYKDSTELERFQRGDARSTGGGKVKFEKIIALSPEDFLQSLDKRGPKP